MAGCGVDDIIIKENGCYKRGVVVIKNYKKGFYDQKFWQKKLGVSC